MLSTPRPLTFKSCILCTRQMQFSNNSRMDSRPLFGYKVLLSSSYSSSPPRVQCEATISLQEWQGWGATSPVPSMVTDVIEDLKRLQIDASMDFGGNNGKLQMMLKNEASLAFAIVCSLCDQIWQQKMQEDKKHRAKYESLGDSEKKLQFFSARQIACRFLGTRGYLCQKCWLPMEDCMCSRIMPCSLWHYIRFWMYVHPKVFLRQNNTGKLLWQVFGTQAATFCLFEISEQEAIMWNALNMAERNKDEKKNFILIDGTWSNSNAMFKHLKDRAQVIWGEELPYISLNTGASLMHKLRGRPQPSWDRTCRAAAAIGLLCELRLVPEFSLHGLDNQSKAIEEALEAPFEALTVRWLQMGRSISRKEKHNSNIC